MIKLTLCREKCCPTVELVNGLFIIKDDLGGQVSLTPGQLSVLVNNFSTLKREFDSCNHSGARKSR